MSKLDKVNKIKERIQGHQYKHHNHSNLNLVNKHRYIQHSNGSNSNVQSPIKTSQLEINNHKTTGTHLVERIQKRHTSQYHSNLNSCKNITLQDKFQSAEYNFSLNVIGENMKEQGPHNLSTSDYEQQPTSRHTIAKKRNTLQNVSDSLINERVTRSK